MQSRREFLKRAALFSGTAGLWSSLDAPLSKALAIEPEPGSSYLDAEHVVILMQENRSFDHCYGSLQGVRGFNDPRAIPLANNNPVWVQTNAAGESYAPFRLNLLDTKSTWLGCLPHHWSSQVDARHGGRHDRWLDAKRAGQRDFAKLPLTLGYYNRQDIPFYYSLADAFTVCDQHFCSSITPTLPNRLFLWTGAVREHPRADSVAHVRNEQIEQNHWQHWMTFPERLEDHGISWKVYQNELTIPSGLTGEEDAWLANFGDNPLEYFSQYHVKAHRLHREFILQQEIALPKEIAAIEKRLAEPDIAASQTARLKQRLKELTARQNEIAAERRQWEANDFAKLTERERALHEKAFCRNTNDPAYRELAEITFQDGDTQRRMRVPKGDVLHQFRDDVANGKLPQVSWLVAPEKLSDHPESAWYGAWYISEALKILTENPAVWKKTIFLLTYDENDGYFDHVPPFVAPHPRRRETGFASKGIDTGLEYVELEQDRKTGLSGPRESPIGLGYRVPLVIASPWSRGGCVCSQVFDHTSVLQFLESFLTQKTGKPIEETNISAWRRTVCGDLTSAFQQSPDAKTANPEYVVRDPFVKHVFQAQFKPLPSGFRKLGQSEIDRYWQNRDACDWLPRQEPGVRRSSALPYELYVDGELGADRSGFVIGFEAKKDRFAHRSAGSPFTAYAGTGSGDVQIRNYAVSAGDRLEDSWPLADFEQNRYQLQVYGPNGFFREFRGDDDDPKIEVRIRYSPLSATNPTLNGNVEVQLVNRDENRSFEIEIADCSYQSGTQSHRVDPGKTVVAVVDTQRSFHWYDFSISLAHDDRFHRRFAGRVETGEWTFSDPAMSR